MTPYTTIAARICHASGIHPSELSSQSMRHNVSRVRKVVVYLCRCCGMNGREIAEHMQKTRSAVSYMNTRFVPTPEEQRLIDEVLDLMSAAERLKGPQVVRKEVSEGYC